MALCRAVSQGSRSASVRAMPLLIFSIFAEGWNSSASANSQPNCVASRVPMVVFPDPVTPMSTTINSHSPLLSLSLPSILKCCDDATEQLAPLQELNDFVHQRLPAMRGTIQVHKVGCPFQLHDLHPGSVRQMFLEQSPILRPRPEIQFGRQYQGGRGDQRGVPQLATRRQIEAVLQRPTWRAKAGRCAHRTGRIAGQSSGGVSASNRRIPPLILVLNRNAAGPDAEQRLLLIQTVRPAS